MTRKLEEVAVRRLSRTIMLAAAVALCAGPAVARADNLGGGVRVVPADVIHGLTGGELVGAGFARGYAGAPETICPTFGRRGEILGMSPTGDTGTCTVKPGTPIVVLGWGSACSDIDPEPFYAVGEAAQRTCARENTHDEVLELHVTVDGGARVDIHSDRFEATSPQMTAVVPEDNPFGVPAGTTAHLVAEAYVAAIRTLTPGRHSIVTDLVTTNFSATSTLIVDVVPGA